MVDPRAVGADQSGGQRRHWLVNGAKISADGKVTFEGATTITAYAGPAPPANSGPHRYTFVIYAQGQNFTPPQNLSSLVPGVPLFDFPGYIKETNLGPLIAGNYYQAEVGTANVSIPVTSPVVTSTLPAAQPTNTGSNNSTSSAVDKAVSGFFLSFAAVLTYMLL